ncbi:MAG: efflux RND transporter periplasmic adaptor subunit [Magnetococcales bacterium]|nr:efflux RND transporter periplasmic adaptor subunit [Magnetococcales bacterium]
MRRLKVIIVIALLLNVPTLRAEERATYSGAEKENAAVMIARRHATISAGMPGRIVRSDHREGVHFSRGEVLVAFDCREQQALLRQAEADVTIHTLNHQRVTREFQLESSGQHDVDIAAAQLEKSRAQVAVQQARVARCNVTAPFSGRVAERMAQPFEQLSIGDPVMRILGDEAPEVEILVPSRTLPLIRLKQPFTLHLESTGKHYSGRLLRISTNVEPVSQRITVFGILESSPVELQPGMSGHVIFD